MRTKRMKRLSLLMLVCLLGVMKGFAGSSLSEPFNVGGITYQVYSYWESNPWVVNSRRKGPNKGVTEPGGGSYSYKSARVVGAVDYLSVLDIPETVPYEGKDIQVTTIDANAFKNRINLYQINMPFVTKIGESAFEGCSGFQHATVNPNVNIGKRSFANCSTLETVEQYEEAGSRGTNRILVFTSGNEIGDSAFAGCTKMTTQFIPQKVSRFGKRAFENCKGLKTVIVPPSDNYETYYSSSITMGNEVFKGCSNIEDVYTQYMGTIPDDAFDQYVYQHAILHVPAGQRSKYQNLGGWKNFVHIDDGSEEEPQELQDGDAFTAQTAEGVDMEFYVSDAAGKKCRVGRGNTANKAIDVSTSGTITIPSSVNGYEVTGINEYAFYGCDKLTGIVVPEGVTDILFAAFAGCESLTQIALPNSLAHLSNYVFYNCSSLSEVFIPKNVKNIEDWLFAGSCGVRKLTVDADNPYFYSMNNCILVDYNADGETVGIVGFACAGSTIPTDAKVKQIGQCSFEEVSGIKEIQIPDNITAIGQEAFCTCSDLETVTIGRNVSLIQPFAFCDNKKLREVYALNPVPVVISDDVFHTQIVWNEDGSFNSSTDFTTATLYVPYGCKAAYQQADGWKNFQNIVEMEPASPIIHFADAEVKRICVENWDTNGDGELSEGEAAAVTTLNGVFKENKSITAFAELRFFTGLEEIGQSDFKYCDNLREVSLPNSLKVIGQSAFYRSGLESIDIPYGVTRIEGFAFRYCRTLKNVTIPNSVTYIGEDALESCDNLVSIIIPASVTSLSSDALSGCASLIEIVVDAENPKFMSSNGILYNKDKTRLLTYPAGKTDAEYVVPASVTMIDQCAFYYTQYLETVTIHKDVASIGWFAFVSNKPISSVTVESKMPIALSSQVFSSKTESEGTLYVPYGSKVAYQQAAGWKNFKNIVEMEADEPELRVERLDIEGDSIAGTKHTIYYKVKNYGATYTGNVYIHSKETTTGAYSNACICSYEIPNNHEFASNIGVTFTFEGTFLIWISTDEEGNNVLGQKEWTVTPAATLTAKSYTREYGEENPDFGFTADKGGFSGTPKITCTADRFSDVGTYDIVIEQGSVDNNYVTLVPGTLTITKAPLTVKAMSYFMRQEGQMPDYAVEEYTGFKNGDNERSFTKGPQFQCAVTPSSAMGDYTIYVSGIEAKNYQPSYVNGFVRLVGRAGDVNRDTYVNTTDVVDVIQYILGKPSLQAVYDGDLNLDDQITMADAASVIYCILNNDRAAARRTAPTAESHSQLGLSIDEQGRLAVTLQNNMPFVAFQFDVTVPEGTNISKVLLSDLRKDGHQVASQRMDGGCYRVLAYSMQNNALRGNDGVLATLQPTMLDGEVTLSNIHFADADGIDYLLPDVSLNMMTGISTLVKNSVFDIYDLNGRLVRRNATSTKGLQRGVYMINNNKVVIK